MPRVRLGVVLVVPPPHATEIDGLRRALGDPVLGRIAPHLTLVPPVNVRREALGDALALLRDAAALTRPFTVEVGPVRSFLPASATLYLAVGGAPDALAALAALRDGVFRAPLHRDLDHAFVPHITVAAEVSEERADAATDALSAYAAPIRFSAVHLLEERHHPGGRRWIPVADVAFGPRTIVGRGGVELELTPSSIIDPEGLALLRDVARDADPATDLDAAPAHHEPPDAALPADVVVTARRGGAVVGVAVSRRAGTATEEATVAVREQDRRQGIGRQLRLALESRLAEAGGEGA